MPIASAPWNAPARPALTSAPTPSSKVATATRSRASEVPAMKPNRIRYQLFLPEDLSHRFEALAAAPGASKSAILTDALTAWLNRQAASELENRFNQRLDRRSEEHTSELQSLMRISYPVFFLTT